MFSGQSRDMTLHDSVTRATISKRLTVVQKEIKEEKTPSLMGCQPMTTRK